MKRVILFIGIVSIGFLAEGEIEAQRRGKEGRNDREMVKVEKRNDDRGRVDNRNRSYSQRAVSNRKSTVVKRVVIRNNGYRYSAPRRNSGWTRVNDMYYDYDFRNERRDQIFRVPAPSSRHIWVNGYWEYERRHSREVWVTGHWTLRRSHHKWQEGRYRTIAGARVWVSGIWVRLF